MIELNGKHYSKNLEESKRLVREGGEAFLASHTHGGFYRLHTNGVLFLDRNKEPFAYAVIDSQTGTCFFVTAHRTEQGTRYMYSTCEHTEKELGIFGLKCSEIHNIAKEVIRQSVIPMYSRFYGAKDECKHVPHNDVSLQTVCESCGVELFYSPSDDSFKAEPLEAAI
jgi:hypothetical protein